MLLMFVRREIEPTTYFIFHFKFIKLILYQQLVIRRLNPRFLSALLNQPYNF